MARLANLAIRSKRLFEDTFGQTYPTASSLRRRRSNTDVSSPIPRQRLRGHSIIPRQRLRGRSNTDDFSPMPQQRF